MTIFVFYARLKLTDDVIHWNLAFSEAHFSRTMARRKSTSWFSHNFGLLFQSFKWDHFRPILWKLNRPHWNFHNFHSGIVWLFTTVGLFTLLDKKMKIQWFWSAVNKFNSLFFRFRSMSRDFTQSAVSDSLNGKDFSRFWGGATKCVEGNHGWCPRSGEEQVSRKFFGFRPGSRSWFVDSRWRLVRYGLIRRWRRAAKC